jgi:Zn-dependent M32 family carboxypeptidase
MQDYVRATAIPKSLAQRMAKLESDAYAAWVEARKASDFSKFAVRGREKGAWQHVHQKEVKLSKLCISKIAQAR